MLHTHPPPIPPGCIAFQEKQLGGDTCLGKQKIAYFKFFLQCQEIPTWVVLESSGNHPHTSRQTCTYKGQFCCFILFVSSQFGFFLRRKKQLPPILSQGKGNGNPLWCSCLENPRDGGAWRAALYGFAQSWTRLKRLSSSSSRWTMRLSQPSAL